MQPKLLAFMIALLLFVTNSLQAQSEKSTEKMRELKDVRAKEMQTKSDANRSASAEKQKAMQQQQAGMKPGSTPGMASDLKLSADEEKRSINGYKVDFASNPYSSPDNAIASISLYNGTAQNQQKIGIIHFYAKGAKMLVERKTVDDNKFVTLHYDLDGFAAVQEFLGTGNRLALIHNNKTKESYISTDVMPTRTK